MIVVVMVALGRCCSGLVHQRTWLGPGGVLLVIAAGLAAYGINSAFCEPLRTTPALRLPVSILVPNGSNNVSDEERVITLPRQLSAALM